MGGRGVRRKDLAPLPGADHVRLHQDDRLARRSVWIQSPYFMPDFALLDALKIAARSGVDVRLMIPDKPVHLLVYPATLSYADELSQAGARVLIYRNGFLHAKTVLVDHELGSVGTANLDYRSFRLNFEVNAFFYDTDLGDDCATSTSTT